MTTSARPSDRHKSGVQKLFSVLKEKGFIYLDTYTGQLLRVG